jgi:hypothetical protein
MEEKATTKHIVLRGANANRPMVRRNAMSDTAALMRGGRSLLARMSSVQCRNDP